MKRIAVIGGGIAGLTAAYRLGAEHDVVAFERETTAGGKIRSQHIDGFLFEWGPGGFLSSAEELHALVGDLGLRDALSPARPVAKNRFVYWNGALHKLPTKPPDALKMTLLSPLGKVRALDVVTAHAEQGLEDPRRGLRHGGAPATSRRRSAR